jgi:hypothetical protein
MKIINLKLIALLFCYNLNVSYSQNFQSQRNEVLAYNILTNGIISGIGGVINKKKGEKFFPVFLKSFGKGSLGGLIKYSAKNQLYYQRSETFSFLAPINRAYFFLGHSIALNGSRNIGMLDDYHCNFYGINFNYKYKEKQGNRFSARLSLATMASVITIAADKNKLDFYRSLKYGQFYFDLSPNSKLSGPPTRSFSGFNSFAIERINGRANYDVIPHELVHTYQSYDFYSISSFYEKPLKKLLNKSSFYNKAIKYVDFDYEPLIFGALYLAQPKPTYFRNFFEFEAEHFSRRRFINR